MKTRVAREIRRLKKRLRQFKETLKSFLENPSNFSLRVGTGRCRVLFLRSSVNVYEEGFHKNHFAITFSLYAPMEQAKPPHRR